MLRCEEYSYNSPYCSNVHRRLQRMFISKAVLWSTCREIGCFQLKLKEKTFHYLYSYFVWVTLTTSIVLHYCTTCRYITVVLLYLKP